MTACVKAQFTVAAFVNLPGLAAAANAAIAVTSGHLFRKPDPRLFDPKMAWLKGLRRIWRKRAMQIFPLTPTIGAELSGVDLTQFPDQAMLDEIYDALMKHLVVFFRDQDISPADHLALARSFGQETPPHPLYSKVEDYPEILKLENDANTPPDTGGWHTDMTFCDDPPFASVLWARKVPEVGGDTIWCNLHAAYEALSSGMKQDIEDLVAVHDMGDFRNNFTVGETSPEKLVEAHGKMGSALHPVVKIHPVTGRKLLYVSESFTDHIVGYQARESQDLLRYLYDHMSRPEFQVRFRWRDHSMAIWDNRCTMHYAVNDYLPHYRCMHRVTVINDHRAQDALKKQVA